MVRSLGIGNITSRKEILNGMNKKGDPRHDVSDFRVILSKLQIDNSETF